MNRRGIIASGTAGFGLLSVLAVTFGTGTIEHDLTGKTRDLLAAEGVQGDLRFSGRDGTLRTVGTLPPGLLDEIRGAHRRDFDVRRFVVIESGTPTTAAPPTTTVTVPSSAGVVVTDAATTLAPTDTSPPPAPTSTAAPPTTPTPTVPTTLAPATIPADSTPSGGIPSTVAVAAQLDHGTLTITGTVASIIERAALLIGATHAVGEQHVVDQLVVTEGDTLVGDPQAAGLERVLERFGTDLSPASATIANGVLTVTGATPSFEAQIRLQAALDLATAQGVQVADNVSSTPLRLTGLEFPTGGADLGAAGQAQLDRVVTTLADLPPVRIEVSGHTDDSGAPEANLALSRRRADAVVAYLVAHGVSPSRLVAAGYGAGRPVADNATPDGRQRNRRIEFTVIGG